MFMFSKHVGIRASNKAEVMAIFEPFGFTQVLFMTG